LWGVLFADGQSWGNSDWVSSMIAARRRILDDIPKAMELLTQAKGKATSDRLALVSQFKKLSEDARNSVLNAPHEQLHSINPRSFLPHIEEHKPG
jgi:hypothetical protein